MKNEYIIYLKRLSEEAGLTIDREKSLEINSTVLKYTSLNNIAFTLIKPVLIWLVILTIVGIGAFFTGVPVGRIILYALIAIIATMLLGIPRGMINVAKAFHDDILKILSLVFDISKDILTNIRSLTAKKIPKLTDIIRFVLYGYVLPSIENAIHKKVFFMKNKIYNFLEMIIGRITDAVFYAVKQVPVAEEVIDIGSHVEVYSADIISEIKLNIDTSIAGVEGTVRESVTEIIDKNLNAIDRNDRIKQIDSTVSDIHDKIEVIVNNLIEKKLAVVSNVEKKSKDFIDRVFLPTLKTMKKTNWVLAALSIMMLVGCLMGGAVFVLVFNLLLGIAIFTLIYLGIRKVFRKIKSLKSTTSLYVSKKIKGLKSTTSPEELPEDIE
jgi:hypothetical protein